MLPGHRRLGGCEKGEEIIEKATPSFSLAVFMRGAEF